eukprot:tig00021582_g22623.t1
MDRKRRPLAFAAVCGAAVVVAVALAGATAWGIALASDLRACSSAVAPRAGEEEARRLLELNGEDGEFQERVAPLLERSAVPKVLHQIWLDSGRGPKQAEGQEREMPARWKKASYSCQPDALPGYSYVLWTDEKARAFVAKEYPDILPIYDAYPNFVQRADALRYMVMARLGGVYADLDVVCMRSPDTLRTAPAMLFSTEPAGITNDFLVSRPGHPFFEQAVEGLRGAAGSYGAPYLTVLFSTGTVFLSRQLAKYMRSRGGPEAARFAWDRIHAQWPGRTAPEDAVLVLSHEPYIGGGNTAFVSHVGGSSWHEADAAAVKWVAGHLYLSACLVAALLAPLLACCLVPRVRRWAAAAAAARPPAPSAFSLSRLDIDCTTAAEFEA